MWVVAGLWVCVSVFLLDIHSCFVVIWLCMCYEELFYHMYVCTVSYRKHHVDSDCSLIKYIFYFVFFMQLFYAFSWCILWWLLWIGMNIHFLVMTTTAVIDDKIFFSTWLLRLCGCLLFMIVAALAEANTNLWIHFETNLTSLWKFRERLCIIIIIFIFSSV